LIYVFLLIDQQAIAKITRIIERRDDHKDWQDCQTERGIQKPLFEEILLTTIRLLLLRCYPNCPDRPLLALQAISLNKNRPSY
jgi:hypothetical protein